MLIYAGTKSDFMIDIENDRLETKLYKNIKIKDESNDRTK